MTIAHHAGKAGLPWHQPQCRQITHRHIVRAIGRNAGAPDSATGKTCACGEDVLDMAGGHRLDLGRAVDVDKLRQNKFNLMLFEELLRLRKCIHVPVSLLITMQR